MHYLQQSTVAPIKIGPFLDEDDGKTVEASLVITQADWRLSKNGGSFAQKHSFALTGYDEKGWYGSSVDAIDTNTLGRLLVNIHESGALPVWREFMVITAEAFEALTSSPSAALKASTGWTSGGTSTFGALMQRIFSILGGRKVKDGGDISHRDFDTAATEEVIETIDGNDITWA